jgi:hypothetical protein
MKIILDFPIYSELCIYSVCNLTFIYICLEFIEINWRIKYFLSVLIRKSSTKIKKKMQLDANRR